MAIQIEGKYVTLRWDDNGLLITEVIRDPFVPRQQFEMSPEAAQEFTNLFTMGQHALSVGYSIQFSAPQFPTKEED